jgi:hypothetical protein
MCCSLESVMMPPIMMSSSGGYGSPSVGPGALVLTFFTAFVYSVMTLVFLVRAKGVLEERAFIQRRNPFAHQFRQLDQYWKDLRKLLRAILRKRDREANAVAAQVVQRGLGVQEQHAWSLGGFLLARMQIPTLLSFAIIFGVIALIVLITDVVLDPKSGGAFYLLVAALWLFALITVPIQSANAVASERINERLGAILTTPLSTREILGEWLAPVRRWIQFLIRPLIVIFVAEALVKFKTQKPADPRWTNLALYLGISLMTIWVYPELARWSGLWIGLRVRNQVRALMTSLLLMAGWCFLPLAGSGYLVQTGLMPLEWNEPLRFISPVTVISITEALGRRAAEPAVTSDMVVMACIQLGLAAALMLWIRRRCLTDADRHLGRV